MKDYRHDKESEGASYTSCISRLFWSAIRKRSAENQPII